jgi:hypothetical protein
MVFSAASTFAADFWRRTTPPQHVVADRVAAVELPHAVELVVVRRLPLWPANRRPRGSAGGSDRQGSELVEREAPIGVSVENFFDAVELRVAVGIVGLLPGLGPLEGHIVR